MIRPSRMPRRGERGYILVLVLVVLVAMLVSGIALVRSMDTGQLVAGNLASRSATVHSADAAIQSAITWLQTQANAGNGVLYADAATSGYYAEVPNPEPYFTPSFWTKCAACSFTDASGNNVSWVVHRMCNLPGNPNGVGMYCSTVAGSASNNNSMSSDASTYNGVAAYYYRITVQVRDSRNTTTLSQAFITM